MPISEASRAALEASGAKADYASSGYLGLIEEEIGGKFGGCESSPLKSWCENWELLSAAISLSGGITSLNWSVVVKDVVFAPYGMNDELRDTRLSGARQPWSSGKSLIFATGMLTDEVVLNQYGALASKQMYNANAGGDAIPTQATATPAFFVSAGTVEEAPAFFAAGPMDLRYSSNSFTDPGPGPVVPLAADIAADSTVLSAATASSAAAAAAASRKAVATLSKGLPIPLTSAEIAFLLSDFAPAFDMGESPIVLKKQPQSEDLGGWRDLEKIPLARFADGGYCDNTAVAYTLRYLEENNLADGFSIVAFDNTDGTQPFGKGAELATDVAGLFGVDSDQMCMGGRCISTISRQVFEKSALDVATPLWSYESAGVNLSYVSFSVVTVDNPSFGIEAEHTGVLHLFTSSAPDAPAAPASAATFTAYETLLDVVYEGVTEHGGWEHLKNALDL